MRTQFAGGSPDQTYGSHGSLSCLFCENLLTLHQPDEELADRLLGTCYACKAWFLTNFEGTVLVPIPDLPDEPFSVVE